jgi:hypothetical protein
MAVAVQIKILEESRLGHKLIAEIDVSNNEGSKCTSKFICVTHLTVP